MISRKKIMVLDGSSRAALAIVRSFGKKNIDVIVGGSSRYSRSFYSKYCRGCFVYPENNGLRGAHEIILNNIQRFKPDVLMPIFSNTVSIILKYHQEYSKYTRLIPLPEYSVYEQFDDKAEFLKLAQKNGIAIPETYFPQDKKQALGIASAVKYPVLIKPRISAGGFGIRIAYRPAELIARYTEITQRKKVQIQYEPFDAQRPIIQRFVDGPSITVQAYCERGEAKAVFITQSLRRHPSPFGPSVAYKTIKNKELKQIILDFLKKIKWHGPIILSFIIDSSDGIPKMIEANPRLGGTVESAIASGIDIPFRLFQKALGQKVDAFCDYKAGKIFRWILFGEFFYLKESKEKIKALIELLDFRNSCCEISFIDFKPHLIHLMNLLKTRQEVR